MMTTTNSPVFSGPYSELLTELSQVVESISVEHGTSFVKAGDDKVFALGGGGYVILFDEKRWDGFVELFTPDAALSIKRDDAGKIGVTAANLEEPAVKAALRSSIDALKAYYAGRYWQTP